MNYSYFPLLLTFLLLGSSCSLEKQVIGLWQIENVKVGQDQMTPIARWTRLHQSHQQESGNGWMQHSIGHWQMDTDKKRISIINTNGLEDEYGGFEVSLEKEKMIWQREEEGQQVEITLKRIEQIPQAPANQLLGVWRLQREQEVAMAEAKAYLFIRWDQIIVNGEKGKEKKYGTYKTHGHKQELQIIYYEDPLRLETWQYQFNGTNQLSLSGERDGQKIDLQYERTNRIPN